MKQRAFILKYEKCFSSGTSEESNLSNLHELLDDGWNITNTSPMGGVGGGALATTKHCALVILEKDEETKTYDLSNNSIINLNRFTDNWGSKTISTTTAIEQISKEVDAFVSLNKDQVQDIKDMNRNRILIIFGLFSNIDKDSTESDLQDILEKTLVVLDRPGKRRSH